MSESEAQCPTCHRQPTSTSITEDAAKRVDVRGLWNTSERPSGNQPGEPRTDKPPPVPGWARVRGISPTPKTGSQGRFRRSMSTLEQPQRAAPKRGCAIDGCRAYPLRNGDRCLAHADPEVRESVGFVAANGFGGRRAIPGPDELLLDALREAAHAKADRLIHAYTGALDEPDPDVRMRGADRIYDRLVGKPTQRSEVSVEGTVSLEHLFCQRPNEATSTLLPEGDA